ncbi:MAG: YfhO family protein [Clostridia bacterium]|nr:YfhO family protein [Clostridia bacterium]
MRETQQLRIDKKKRREISYYPLISFFISCICFLYIFISNKITPFGRYSFFYSDLKAQYAPFLLLWKNHLSQLDFTDFASSFSYSSKLGLGKNLMGTLGYYLFSPVNLIVLFFKNSQISTVVNLIISIKLSLASAFMCLFCEAKYKLFVNDEFDFKCRSKLPIVLGVMYAFTSYTIILEFNIMWLDGYLLLPLLLYFLEDFIRTGKYKFIVPTLVLLFVSNYYIAYMVGLFSFFYLLIRIIETGKDSIFNRNAIKKIGKYILIAVICAMISAVILVPVALDTLGNADPVIMGDTKDSFNTFPILDILSQFFLGEAGELDFLMHNLPLIFSSIMVTCTAFIYFISSVFDKRTKIIRLASMIFFFAALYFSKINIIFHAFDKPNWFMHRFSFVIFSLTLVICLEVITKIKEISNRTIIYSGIFMVLVLCFVYLYKKIPYEAEDFLYSIALIFIYSLILCLLKKTKWNAQLKDMPKLLPCIMSAILLVESVFLNPSLINQSFFIASLDNSIYSEAIELNGILKDKGENGNKGFRSEYECGSLGDNDEDIVGAQNSLCANATGMSLFSSVSNKEMTRFLKQLGYIVNYNYFLAYYSYMMPSNDAFFSLGNTITIKDYSLLRRVNEYSVETSKNTEEYGEEGIEYIHFENNRVLPLAFPVDSNANVFDFYSLENDSIEKDYLEFNENWFKSMFPYAFSENYMFEIDNSMIEGPEVKDGITYTGYDSENKIQMRTDFSDSIGDEDISGDLSNVINFAKTSDDESVKATYKVTVPKSGELYINVSFPKICHLFDITYDKGNIESRDVYSFISRLGYYNEGDIVTLDFDMPNGLAITSINFAVFDEDAFNSQFDKIDTSAVEMTRFTNGHAEFSVDTSKLNKNNSLILTTIPFEKGWTCYVDGKETSITPYQDAFIAVRMNDNDGKIHKVELKFCAPGLVPGAYISLLGIVLIAILGICDKLLKNKKNQESIVESDNNEKYNNVTEVKV